MNRQRAALAVNFGEGSPAPSDILARLREDLLGSGVQVHVASIASFDNGNCKLYAELINSNLPHGANLQEAAQKALNEVYGELEDAATIEVPASSPAVTDEKSSETAPVKEQASSVEETKAESSTEQSVETASTKDSPEAKPKPVTAPKKQIGARKAINIGKPEPVIADAPTTLMQN